ncbi:MAG: hypothetical protein ACKVKL_17515 [Pseudomonadales bacterium]
MTVTLGHVAKATPDKAAFKGFVVLAKRRERDLCRPPTLWMQQYPVDSGSRHFDNKIVFRARLNMPMIHRHQDVFPDINL